MDYLILIRFCKNLNWDVCNFNLKNRLRYNIKLRSTHVVRNWVNWSYWTSLIGRAVHLDLRDLTFESVRDLGRIFNFFFQTVYMMVNYKGRETSFRWFEPVHEMEKSCNWKCTN